jgi:uncharacterized membrane protein (UPF0127 family)
MKILIKINDKILMDQILIANSFVDRLMGLMFRDSPPQNSNGLLIDPCNSIHTFFMRYSLDVVFIDSKNKVVKIIYALKPWRMTWIYFKARKTLELPAGKLDKSLKVGDLLEVVHV